MDSLNCTYNVNIHLSASNIYFLNTNQLMKTFNHSLMFCYFSNMKHVKCIQAQNEGTE